MTLTLTAAQEALRLRFRESGLEALYYAKITTFVHGSVIVANNALAGTDLSVRGDVSATETYTEGVSWDAGATVEESASNLATAIRRFSTRFTAFCRGNIVWVRANTADATLVFGGAAISGALITTHTLGMRDYEMVSGPLAIGSAEPVILTMGSAGQKKDGLTHKVTNSDNELVVRWSAFVERMTMYNPLLFKVCEVRRGLGDTPIDDWLPVGKYLVSDGMFPQKMVATLADGHEEMLPAIAIPLADRAQTLMKEWRVAATDDRKFFFEALHPLEHAFNLLQTSLIGSGFTNPFVDAASFDASDTQWSTSYGHHSVGLFDWKTSLNLDVLSTNLQFPLDEDGNVIEFAHEGAIKSSRKVTELLDELAVLIPGHFASDELGIFKAVKVDADNPGTIIDWTNLFVPEQLSEIKVDLLNEFITDFGKVVGGTAKDFWQDTHAFGEEHSQAAHSPTDIPNLGVRSADIETNWLNAVSYGYRVLPDSSAGGNPDASTMFTTAVSFVIMNSGALCFPGGRGNSTFTAPTANPPAWAQLSSDRQAIFKITEGNPFANQPAAFEYISCDAATREEDGGYNRTNQSLKPTMRYTIANRALFGSTSPAAWYSPFRVTDLTIAEAVSAWKLKQYAWGSYKVPGFTPLSEQHVQLGDFVTVNIATLIDFPQKTATNLVAFWQVVHKSHDKNRIRWTIIPARFDEQTVLVPTRPVPSARPAQQTFTVTPS